MTLQLQISQDHVPAFLACLGIGTLSAIRAGILPAETAIWTLGAPSVWEPLIINSKISRELTEVFQTCDELSAIQKLIPDQFDVEIAKLIERLQIELTKIPDPIWRITWVAESIRPTC